jgi:hypothetical protein
MTLKLLMTRRRSMSETKKVTVALTATQHKYFDAIIEIPVDTTEDEMRKIYEGLFRDAEFSNGDWEDGEGWVDNTNPKSEPSMKFTRVNGKMKAV